MTKNPMLYVNRNDFMAWTEGMLLKRFESGQVLIGDKAEHVKAKQLLDADETIGLLVNGELFSTMSLEKDSMGEYKYIERKC